MKLSRPRRIALELLGPAFLGALLQFTIGLVKTVAGSVVSGRWSDWSFRVLQGFAVFLFFAYVFAGIQSVVYALVMEWRFARGLDPCSWRSASCSGF